MRQHEGSGRACLLGHEAPSNLAKKPLPYCESPCTHTLLSLGHIQWLGLHGKSEESGMHAELADKADWQLLHMQP